MTLASRKGIREEDRRRRHWINTKGGVINLHPQRLHKCGVSGRPAHSKLLLFMVPPALLTQTCCDTAWRRAPQELYSATFPRLTYAPLRLHQAGIESVLFAGQLRCARRYNRAGQRGDRLLGGLASSRRSHGQKKLNFREGGEIRVQMQSGVKEFGKRQTCS